MASRGLISRSTRAIQRLEPCVLRQIRFIGRLPFAVQPTCLSQPMGFPGCMESATTIRCYSTLPSKVLDAKRMRYDVDRRSRLGFYTMLSNDKVLKMQPHTAEAIYADFLAHRSKYSNVNNIKRIAEKYKVNTEDLASLGIITFGVPDVSDPLKRARLPPSQLKNSAAQILQGCAECEEPLAVVHILTAVYLNNVSNNKYSSELAPYFSQKDIKLIREILVKLGKRSKEIELGPDALTLQGLFLESEGEISTAKELYLEAIERSHLVFQSGSRHPMLLPLMAPWNALAFLLKKDSDPDVQAHAKKYFEIGVDQADDPLSCYELAGFEDRLSERWLKCMSKAAASGHRQAMVELADYYADASRPDSPFRKITQQYSALKWTSDLEERNFVDLQFGWLSTAAQLGHKPSAMEYARRWADDREKGKDAEEAKHLRMVAGPPHPSANGVEEWPQLVQLAKKRLAEVEK